MAARGGTEDGVEGDRRRKLDVSSAEHGFEDIFELPLFPPCGHGDRQEEKESLAALGVGA